MTRTATLITTALKSLRVTGWTPSRFAKWKECSRKVLLEDLMKLCPVCFQGRVSGGYDGEPVLCDTCSKPQPERAALERGSALDGALTNHLRGVLPQPSEQLEPGERAERAQAALVEAHAANLIEAQRHPAISALVRKLRKLKGVYPQHSIVLGPGWKAVSQFTKGAWGRLKLDILHLTPKRAQVIDWKSGNIDKSTGEIRHRAEYNDSMLAYQIAVLSTNPQAECEATMAFLDAPPKLEVPFKSLPVLKRSGLEAAQKAWEAKIAPMLADTHFAPRPSFACKWCSYSSKNNGGPCEQG